MHNGISETYAQIVARLTNWPCSSLTIDRMIKFCGMYQRIVIRSLGCAIEYECLRLIKNMKHCCILLL